MQPEKTEIEQAVEGIPTLFQSITLVNKVISAMFSYKRPVMYKDISAACAIHPTNVSQALTTAKDLGLTESTGKKGMYVLGKNGVEYARLLSAGKENEAKLFLKNSLKTNPLFTDIMAFLDAAKGQTRDPIDVILEIERKSGKQWKPNMRNRVRDSLVSILDYAGFIQKEGPNIIALPEEDIPQETKNLPPKLIEPQTPVAGVEFAELKGDDFIFQVRKELSAIDFAESQFNAWINYLKKKVNQESERARQSGGVPNQ